MHRDETHQSDSQSPGFIEPDSSRLDLNVKITERLGRLGQWRIDPSLIEFLEHAPEFYGGHAVVTRALLSSTSGAQTALDKWKDTLGERPNPGGRTHRTTREQGDEEESEDADQDNCSDGFESTRAKQESKDKEIEDVVPNPPHPPKRKDVAVKKLNIGIDADVERLLGLALRESEFLLELSNPNIIEFQGYVEDATNHIIWLVFPWEENGNLSDFLASGEWAIPERISLISDVTKGVGYLHSQKPPICHGDLKSLNVLVNSSYRAVIIDFGSARRLAQDPEEKMKEDRNKRLPGLDLNTSKGNGSFQAVFCATTNSITLTGDNYTLRWAAPELLSDDRPTLASDIWALGWIGYEVMTDSIPFHDAKTDYVVVNRVIQGDLPSITEHARMSLIRDLCSLLSKCWNENPDERPTAKDCRNSLHWMPQMVPAPTKTIDPEASKLRHAQLLIKLGHMYTQQDDYTNASDCYKTALDAYHAANESKGKAKALNGLADVYRYQGKLDEAKKLYSEALQIYAGLGASKAKARAHTLRCLAEAHRLGDEEDKAVELYSESYQIYTEIGDIRGKASTLWGLAEVHRSRSQYTEAIALYSKALTMHTEVGDRRSRSNDLWGIGEVHRLQCKYDKAIKSYSESLQLSTEIGDRYNRAFNLCGLADVHRLQGNLSEAITRYTEALQIRSDMRDKQGMSIVLWNLGQTYHRQGNYSDAIARYTEASEAYGEIGDSVWAANALKKVADIRDRFKVPHGHRH